MLNSIFLSPHLDDAVFSCGGNLLKKVKHKHKVLVTTIFTGSTHTKNNIKKASYKSFLNLPLRKTEDQRAMKVIGIDYLYLDFPEVIIRKSKNDIFNSYNDVDKRLEEHIFNKIKEIIDEKKPRELYFPLGIGYHVDHIILRNIGFSLTDCFSGKIYFYEDFPYVNWIDSIDKSSTPFNKLYKSHCVDITPVFNKKIEVALIYKSQIDALFKDSSHLETEMQKANINHDSPKNKYFEKYWLKTG